MDMQNEKIIELTRKQMEKVIGGGAAPDSDNSSPYGGRGTPDCFTCPGTEDNGTKACGRSLQHVSGKLYRCKNDKCSMFLKDQFPMGK